MFDLKNVSWILLLNLFLSAAAHLYCPYLNRYAVRSLMRLLGTGEDRLILLRPRSGEHVLRTENILKAGRRSLLTYLDTFYFCKWSSFETSLYQGLAREKWFKTQDSTRRFYFLPCFQVFITLTCGNKMFTKSASNGRWKYRSIRKNWEKLFDWSAIFHVYG